MGTSTASLHALEVFLQVKPLQTPSTALLSPLLPLVDALLDVALPHTQLAATRAQHKQQHTAF